MATIRIFVEDDIPAAAAALLGRVYPENRWISQAACESYFREMLSSNLWREIVLYVQLLTGMLAGKSAFQVEVKQLA
jgi:hypothetical protein